MKNVPCAFNFSRLETTDAFSIFKETENVSRVDTKVIQTLREGEIVLSSPTKLWKC